MKKWALFSFVFGLLGACETPAPASPYLVVNTQPTDAQLAFPDGTRCQTPCPVLVTEDVVMTVAKAGFRAQTLQLEAGMTGQTTIVLELAAPTMEIEETTLPDL